MLNLHISLRSFYSWLHTGNPAVEFLISPLKDEVLLNNKQQLNSYFAENRGHAVAWLVEALCYIPEGSGFKSR